MKIVVSQVVTFLAFFSFSSYCFENKAFVKKLYLKNIVKEYLMLQHCSSKNLWWTFSEVDFFDTTEGLQGSLVKMLQTFFMLDALNWF